MLVLHLRFLRVQTAFEMAEVAGLGGVGQLLLSKEPRIPGSGAGITTSGLSSVPPIPWGPSTKAGTLRNGRRQSKRIILIAGFGGDNHFRPEASDESSMPSTSEAEFDWFRIATIPEPASMVVFVLGSIGMLMTRRDQRERRP